MQDTPTVHKAPREKRVARGIRMPSYLWDFVDAQAEAVGDVNGGRLIERWVREKYEAVRRVA